MAPNTASNTVSPEILCVSDTSNTTARLRDAVAEHRPPELIETTTDPTVVPELVAVWGLQCVVADAEMNPLSGADLRESLQATAPQVSVIVIPTEPPAIEPTVEQSVSGEPLVDRLDSAHPPDTPAVDWGTESGWLKPVTEADSQRELLAALEERLTDWPSVAAHHIWHTSGDDSLETASNSRVDVRYLPPTVRAVVESATPQPVTETEPALDAALSTDPSTPTQTAVFPLGETAAVGVDLETVTPAVANRIQRLTMVAGGCLDYQRSIGRLENRFRQSAEHNRELSQFARTVAHDINSPLSVVYGRIELAMDEHPESEIQLQAALNAAKRVDSLVTDHLQSIEAADADGEREPVSIQTVAIQAWRIVDPSTARLQVEPQLETVEANPIRLQQLFENLIRNAIEHGSEESVGLGARQSRDPHAVFNDDTESVTVTIKPTDSGFAVCDDGPGIPSAERKNVFESGYTTTEAGSGLGLYIVSEIVDSHGWEISVTESQSGGARFEIDTE